MIAIASRRSSTGDRLAVESHRTPEWGNCGEIGTVRIIAGRMDRSKATREHCRARLVSQGRSARLNRIREIIQSLPGKDKRHVWNVSGRKSGNRIVKVELH